MTAPSITLPAATTGVDGLVVRTGSAAHGLPAQVKVVPAVLFLLVIVSTGRRTWPVLLVGAALVLVAVALARLPPMVVLRRCVVEVPFALFAVALPFVASGERVVVAGVGLSKAGLVGGALLLAKSTIGVLVGIWLAATTTPRELLAGLGRLRLPVVLIGILGFALRYLDLAADDLRRAETARLARGGGVGRWQALRTVAGGAGAVFVRTYERGERVHLAMTARGMSEAVVVPGGVPGTRRQWAVALLWPAAAAAALAATTLWTLRR